MLAQSVGSNVQEVFNYFTKRKGKSELPGLSAANLCH